MAQRSAAGSAVSSRAPTPPGPSKKKTGVGINTSTSIKSSTPTSAKSKDTDQRQMDIAAMGLDETKVAGSSGTGGSGTPEEVPRVSLAREKLLEEAQRSIANGSTEGKKAVSIVVIGKFLRSRLWIG